MHRNPPQDSGVHDGAQKPDVLAPRCRLEPGDRFPDFILPDQADKARHFTERALGRGLVVVLDPGAATMEELARLAAECHAAELDRIAIDASAAFDPGFPLLADGAGKIRAGLREMCGHPGSRPLAFLLDRNQRILDLQEGEGTARWALTRWAAEPSSGPAHRIGMSAPVLLIPNVLSPQQCRALIARWETEGHKAGAVTSMVEGKVVSRVYEDLKKRRDHRLSDPAVRGPLLALIARRLAPELDKAFHFRDFAFDRILIACYDAERGDYFRRHRDNQTPETAGRRFALTLNLNSDEHDGGELMFPEYGDHLYKPPTGGAVLFSCSLLHEALPVRSGRRFALLSFLRDAGSAGQHRG